MESFSHSPVLFVESDGRALEFYSYYTGEDRATVVLMIEHGGGIFHSEKVESAVCLVDLGDDSVEKGAGQVAVSMKFIWDCCDQNILLDVGNYILTTLPKPFRREEDITIVKSVLKHAEYPRMALDQFYQSLTVSRIFKRDAYSIKSRAKRIYYQIEDYNLSENDEKKFKSVIKPALMYGSYCENDDYVMLNYLKNHISRVHQRELYVEMEKKKILQHSSKSLFFRALKLIFPNIDLYDVDAEFKSRVKKHLSQIHSIQNEASLKDYVMIHYVLDNIKHVRNIALYKKMEEKKILNHSAEYMQLRFLYHILPNIGSYNIPGYFKKRFKNLGFDGFSIFYEEPLSVSLGRKYTKDEDYIILHYLQERKAGKTGIAVFHEMEKERVLNRSASSMHSRVKKIILPTIDSYDIPHSLKLLLKKKNKRSQSQMKGIVATVSNSDANGLCPSDSEMSVHSNSDIPGQTGDKTTDFGGNPSENGVAKKKNPYLKPTAGSSNKVIEDVSSENNVASPAVLRKRKKCQPLPDSDSDSVASDHSMNTGTNVKPAVRITPNTRRSRSNTGRSRSNTTHSRSNTTRSRTNTTRSRTNTTRSRTNTTRSRTNRSSRNRTQKQTGRAEESNATYAGDVFNYFLSQRSLPDDGSSEVDAFFSQNSLISGGPSRSGQPCSLETPCFLQAVLNRCQVPTEDESSDTDELMCKNIEEHFPVEVKMRFLSQAIALLQNIEYNTLFQECVHDSLFYQKLVFRIYRLNGTVYKNFLEKEVSSIMAKDTLSLTDKTVLIKYLSCLEKISPENPLEVFSRFKLR